MESPGPSAGCIPDSSASRLGSRIDASAAAGTPALVVLIGSDLPHGMGFGQVDLPPLSRHPCVALGGIMKGNASRVPGQQPEPQLAADHQIMLGLVAETDIVERVAQPAGEVRALPIALGARLGEPCDGLLAVLWNANTELVRAPERELAFVPALRGAGLVQLRSQVPVFRDDGT